MFAGKPIIGLSGGIGSGKSFVAGLFAEAGCKAISSDELAAQAYAEPSVVGALREWWGDAVFGADGRADRQAIAARVFSDAAERARIERLIHPHVVAARTWAMEVAAADSGVVAYVWDTPLLFETGLDAQCDHRVFVDAPREVRLERLRRRGWDEQELDRREKSQWPLERKRALADDIITNTADAAFARGQVVEVLSRVLASSEECRHKRS